MKVDFSVPVLPMSLNNAYYNLGNGGRRLNDKGKMYKATIGWSAKEAMRDRPFFKNPIFIHFEFYYPDNRLRDLDNAIKLTLDSLKGICFTDDSEVTKIIAEKKKGPAKIHIIIEQIYNLKKNEQKRT